MYAYSPDDPSEFDYDDRPCTIEHGNMKDRLETVKDYLIDVLAELYSGDDELDVDRLENCLEEMASQVGLRIPANKLMIRRSK